MLLLAREGRSSLETTRDSDRAAHPLRIGPATLSMMEWGASVRLDASDSDAAGGSQWSKGLGFSVSEVSILSESLDLH